MHIAVGHRDIKLTTVQKLIELGCSADKKDSEDAVPLKIAIIKKVIDLGVLRYLYEKCIGSLTVEEATELLALRLLNPQEEPTLADGIKRLDIGYAQIPTEPPEIIETIKSKTSQLGFPVDEEISKVIDNLLTSKKSDIFTKETMFESICDFLGVDLSQLASLVSLTYGSNFLPFYHGTGGDPDGDFGGGNSGVIFDGPPESHGSISIILLENGTFVFPEYYT